VAAAGQLYWRRRSHAGGHIEAKKIFGIDWQTREKTQMIGLREFLICAALCAILVVLYFH
jgi:hypothetical protein